MLKVPGRGITDVLLRSAARVRWHGPAICPVCTLKIPREENAMVARWSVLGRYKSLFYVDNVSMKCPRCKLILTFGVPISEEEHKEELAERKKLELGKCVSAEMEIDARQMRERLTELGYLPRETE